MAQTLYVNPATGNNSAAGTQSNPVKTITFALKQAQSGTKIVLASGKYNAASGEVFPLAIPSGVTIVGNEASKGSGILIEGSDIYKSRILGNQNVTLSLDNNAELRGVTVTNPIIRGTAVWIESTNPTVANCTLTKCKREGVFVTGAANPIILSNVFIENNGNGITFTENAKGEMRGNTCFKTGYGITLSETAAPLIVDNKISENRGGIVIAGSSRPVLRNNLIEKNSDNGVTIISNALPDLGSSQNPGGNILRSNGQFDLQNATSTKLIVAGNQINPTRVKGSIDFINNQVATIEPQPSPSPKPNPSPQPSPSNLTDISGHWAAAFIQGLVKQGIISGFPDGTFKPDANMTRAEYAALLAKAFNPTTKRDAIKFSDVPESFWGFAAIQKAYKGEFVAGFPDKSFRPNENVQRTQVIVSLVNGLGLKGGVQTALKAYDDQAAIPDYAKDEVATATQKRLIVNYPKLKQFNPTKNATRAEVAAMVYQALVDTKRLAAINSSYIVSA